MFMIESGLYTTTTCSTSQHTCLHSIQGGAPYNFLNEDVTDVFKQRSGQDITQPLNKVYAKMDSQKVAEHKACLSHAFFVGQKDFRKGARCQVQNYFMIISARILGTSMLVKCEWLEKCVERVLMSRRSPCYPAAVTETQPGDARQVRIVPDPVLHRG
jgi:hypothetical protein